MSSRNDILLSLYKDKATVFTIDRISKSQGVKAAELKSLRQKLNNYVKRGHLQNPRKGIYTKTEYDVKELACCLYPPCYISLEYVLQRNGIVFQFDETVTCVSYLSRAIEIGSSKFQYHKIKGEILTDDTGIIRSDSVNIATPERAFLDVLYLNSHYTFDNPHNLSKQKVMEILPVFNSKTLTERAVELLK